jgi:mannan endo-1,4-beta-mannosidase
MTSSYGRTAARRSGRQKARRTKNTVIFAIFAVVVIGVAATLLVVRPWVNKSIHPVQSVRYLGVYEPNAPKTYAGVDQFAQEIGTEPDLVSYYSDWLEPFQAGFVTSAARHGALTVVQIDPKTQAGANVQLTSIASGQYDSYLRSYAAAVETFGGKVVLSFGHEMNGNWYQWGYQHASPAAFVAAWRHIVTVFRSAGAKNVIWLWTVNIIDQSPYIPDPNRWWPGSSYVTWVAVDGYYYLPTQDFAQVFGPTIVAVRSLTEDPMLLGETGAAPGTGQAAKINDLFAGIRTYGLYGFVWFDENTQGKTWRLNSQGAFAAFRQDARKFLRPPTAGASAAQSPSSGASSS